MWKIGSAPKPNCLAADNPTGERESGNTSEVSGSNVHERMDSLSKTVLLVDDNPIQLSARQMVLNQAGLEVQIATSAESALALLRSLSQTNNIGVVVTDHIMPQTTGSEFVRLLRDVNPDVPVIVISGMAEAQQEYEGMNVTFRQKPCPPPELIALVQSAANGDRQ